MKLLLEGSNCCEEDEWAALNDVGSQYLKGEYFKIEIQNFGWRKRNGVKYVQVQSFTALLSKILPYTECNFKLYRDKGVLKLQNSHHDSPTGAEWYIIRPCACSTYENNNG